MTASIIVWRKKLIIEKKKKSFVKKNKAVISHFLFI